MKMIGVVEALIGVGLMLPQILNIAPWLTPLAALGAVCTMIGAIALHIQRKDGAEAIATNLFIIALAIFVASKCSPTPPPPHPPICGWEVSARAVSSSRATSLNTPGE